jgi:hypothetical protein
MISPKTAYRLSLLAGLILLALAALIQGRPKAQVQM